MKYIAIIGILLSTISFSQTNTTTQSGNFYSPLSWDCLCVPANGDTLIIMHDIDMTAGIGYTAGQIHVTTAGFLSDGGVDQDIYINGGSFINDGTIECDGFWLDSGSVTNTATMNLDSLWTQDVMTNSGIITTIDFLNDQTADFSSSNTVTISNNFNNQGLFQNSGEMTVANDFSNCNIQTMDAIFTNSGIVCITNDFTNCAGDTLRGNGSYHIGGSSSNLGVFTGSHTFNTPSGTVGIPGTINGGVTIGSSPCGLSLSDEELNIVIYPNPATDFIYTSDLIISYEIYDYSGKLVVNKSVQNGTIDVQQLESGIYIIKLTTESEVTHSSSFVKE